MPPSSLEPASSGAFSDDLGDGSIAKAVLQGITEEDFSSSAVDALLSMVQAGHYEVLGDVLVYLAQHQHPDWAAELCRMVMAGPDGAATERDFETIAQALAHAVQSAPLALTRKVCTYILEIKDNGQGGSFFDCFDISFVLGHMVKTGSSTAAGQILFDLYCDDSDQGHMYQSLVPHVLGALIDKGHTTWAVELGKQLMYEDGERSIDYSCMAWAMAQMVYCGRHDWAAALCDGMLSQHLRWYNQGAMLQAVCSWGDQSYGQAIVSCMSGGGPSPGGRGGRSPHGQQGRHNNSAGRNITSPRGTPHANGTGENGLQAAMEGLKVRDNGAVAAAPASPASAASPAGGPQRSAAATASSPLVPGARAFVPAAAAETAATSPPPAAAPAAAAAVDPPAATATPPAATP